MRYVFHCLQLTQAEYDKKNNKFLYFGILLEADDWQTERKCLMKSNFPFLCQIENLLNFEAMSMNICRFKSYV